MMLLEAFSDYLKQRQPPIATPRRRGRRSSTPLAEDALLILHDWLRLQLQSPPSTVWQEDPVGDAIKRHFTLAPAADTGHLEATAKDVAGEEMLGQLMAYCDSYEAWQFRRTLHNT
jgi:hypothetical protein